MARRAGAVLGPREAARQNLDVVRSRGNPARAAEIGRERLSERETHTEHTIESPGKGGQALLVAFVLFSGWLFLTGRLQEVWRVLLMGPAPMGAMAGGGMTAPLNPMGPGYSIRPIPPPPMPGMGVPVLPAPPWGTTVPPPDSMPLMLP